MKNTLLFVIALLCPYMANFKALAKQHLDSTDTRQYNLNHYNGLPSNHVYCMLTDRHGYLYIGTDKGVVRYNGYSFKTFDIPDADVWDLYEDKKGRVWLFRISEELGYIYNDTYHKVYVKPSSLPYIYPRCPQEYSKGILFLGTSHISEIYLRMESNDTLYSYNTGIKGHEGNTLFISSDLKIFASSVNGLYQIYLNGLKAAITKKCEKNTSTRLSMVNNFLLLSGPGYMNFLSTINCAEYKVNLDKGETVLSQYHNKQKGFIVTNKNVYSLKSNKITKYDLSNYLTPSQLDNNRIVYMLQDSFWHTCVSTVHSGIYMSMPIPVFKKITAENLSSFKYAGCDNYKTQYWWSNEKKKLAIIKPNNKLTYSPMLNLYEVRKVIPYKGDEMILMAKSGFYQLNIKTFKIKNLFKHDGPYYFNALPDSTASMFANGTTGAEATFENGMDGMYTKNTLTTITKGGMYTDFQYRSDSLIQTVYYSAKFSGMVYDSVLKITLLYTNKDILIHKNGKLYEYRNIVNQLGIKRINKILTDQKYGNLFIQDYDKIVVYNYNSGKKINILDGYKLENSKICVNNSSVIVAGGFGVLFCNISGPLKISSPIISPNTKNLVYHDILDVTSRGEKAIINTDSGLFALDIPNYTIAKKTLLNTEKYNFIVNYNDTQHVIKPGDTLVIEQTSSSLLFDIIKPTGVGIPRFKTHINDIDSGWQNMNANELLLTKMNVGSYYQLKLLAEDDVWKSTPVKLVLYIQPYWWQTTIAKRLIFITCAISITIIVLLIIYYTRKIAVKSHIKKNYLLSLELKSIYAQINPHFIFNTLNTGLYFISENKNKEAYTHISSFSELLRSYIKSSRSKYVSLAEEIENIENYIKLQQNRFEDKFEYKIYIESNIHTHQKHIPAMLLQPFVENAIYHGFLHKKGKGNLEIKIISGIEENTIICTIDDDGIGRAESKKIYIGNKNKPTSYGNDLIQDLIKIINTDNKLKISIEYTDEPEPLVATRVIITVKELHHE